MRSKTLVGLAGLALSATALAGCSSPATTSSAPAETSTPAASESPTTASGSAEVAVGDSSLGKIIVDSKKMTAYIFTKDTANSGKSVCTGPCLVAWPPIFAASKKPTVEGVTGKVGTIELADGKQQVTVNGLPIYTYVKDKAVGEVTGQGVGGVWFVLSPDGKQITKPASGS